MYHSWIPVLWIWILTDRTYLIYRMDYFLVPFLNRSRVDDHGDRVFIVLCAYICRVNWHIKAYVHGL